MKISRLILFVVLALMVIAGAGYWWRSRGGPPTTEKAGDDADKTAVNAPTAEVKTVLIREGTLTENLAVSGTVIPAPDAVQVVSVPFECQVRHVLVSEGQTVTPGDPLLVIEPSPDTYLEIEKARSTYASTKEGLRQMQQRFDLKLITKDQLLQAEGAFKEAELSLDSMKRRGIDGLRDLTADVNGLSSKVHVQEGAIVPAGDPLVEIVAENQFEIKFGFEPEDIDRIRPEMPVSITHANAPDASAATGRIRKISRSVNPSTRLADVFVTIPPATKFLLGEHVFGTIPVASAKGLIVPRSAVLPREEEQILFTVTNNRAVRHAVRIGLENQDEIEVIGGNLRAGDPVVVLGNYELEDGMAVKPESQQ